MWVRAIFFAQRSAALVLVLVPVPVRVPVPGPGPGATYPANPLHWGSLPSPDA